LQDQQAERGGGERGRDQYEQVAGAAGHHAHLGWQQVDVAGTEGAEQRGAVRRARIGEQVRAVAAADADEDGQLERRPERSSGAREDDRRRRAASSQCVAPLCCANAAKIVIGRRSTRPASRATRLRRSRRVRRWIRAPGWSTSGRRDPSTEAQTATIVASGPQSTAAHTASVLAAPTA
jgi:hypothetical protein